MMKYPKSYLEEIKTRLRVSQVVGKHVSLKKRGKEFIGLSPFKNEKTPSFTVNDDKGFYHCFSSGEHGNIFDFLMKTQSLGFGEAVRVLATEAGMPKYQFTKIDEEKDKRFQVYKKILKDYKDISIKSLLEKKNYSALEYLKKRGLNLETIKNFEIGFVPNSEDSFNQLSKKYSEEDLIRSGLFYKNEKREVFVDRFYSRVIFPINNLSEETIAFGGRIINNSKLAKYINSPETEFYKKGKILFNLDKVKKLRSSFNEVLIVEGYLDVISLYSLGIKNVIANSGTSFTENQILLLWNFFSNLIFCMDGDESGKKAANRMAEKFFYLITESNKIYFLNLPDDKDPDDYIKKNGKENFIKLIEKKESVQDFIWNLKISKTDTSDPFENSKLEKEMRKIINTLKDTTLKKYILEQFLNKINKLSPNQINYKKFKKRNVSILSETKKIHKLRTDFSKSDLKELSIIYILLNYPIVARDQIDELAKIKFKSEIRSSLKKDILQLITKDNFNNVKIALAKKYDKEIKETDDHASIKYILNKKKNTSEISEILSEIILELTDLEKIEKIESAESELMKNLNENSYSELLKLKNQINSD